MQNRYTIKPFGDGYTVGSLVLWRGSAVLTESTVRCPYLWNGHGELQRFVHALQH